MRGRKPDGGFCPDHPEGPAAFCPSIPFRQQVAEMVRRQSGQTRHYRRKAGPVRNRPDRCGQARSRTGSGSGIDARFRRAVGARGSPSHCGAGTAHRSVVVARADAAEPRSQRDRLAAGLACTENSRAGDQPSIALLVLRCGTGSCLCGTWRVAGAAAVQRAGIFIRKAFTLVEYLFAQPHRLLAPYAAGACKHFAGPRAATADYRRDRAGEALLMDRGVMRTERQVKRIAAEPRGTARRTRGARGWR